MVKVAVIGECMVELIQNKNNTYTQSFGGDTFNFGLYLKRNLKNVSVEYISVVGQDELSSQMLDFFTKNNIQTSFIDRIPNKNLGLYIINTIQGERIFTYWRGQSAAREVFSTQSLLKIENELPKYDLIYFSAITLAIMHKESIDNLFKIIKKAKKKNVKIAFDSNYRPALYKNINIAKKLYNRALKLSDIFLPSINDEKSLWGDEITTEEIIKKSLKAGCNEIVIKCGNERIIYNYQGLIKSQKTLNIEQIVDSTAAGDSFNGAYLAARLQKLSPDEAITKAKNQAAKVIMHQGAIIPKNK